MLCPESTFETEKLVCGGFRQAEEFGVKKYSGKRELGPEFDGLAQVFPKGEVCCEGLFSNFQRTEMNLYVDQMQPSCRFREK